MKKLLWLIRINLFISAFTFGGGYVVIPMIRKYYVEEKHYFSEDELMNMAAVAQSTPGAIAINLAVLAGYKTDGVRGALICCIASIIPPLVILAIISNCYDAFRSQPLINALLQGMEAGVAALIVDLLIDMVQVVLKQKSIFLNLLMPFVFIGSYFFQINVAYLLIISCFCCIIQVWIKKRRMIHVA